MYFWKKYMKNYQQTETYKKARRKYEQTKSFKEVKKRYESKKSKDPFWRLSQQFSRAIRHYLKGGKGGRSWVTLVGYNRKDLKQHFEKNFNKKIDWNNYGDEWQIGHQIPVSWFNSKINNKKDIKDNINFQLCWKLNNLLPEAPQYNMSKHDRYDFGNKRFTKLQFIKYFSKSMKLPDTMTQEEKFIEISKIILN